MVLLLKLAALISFLGGPMVLMDTLRASAGGSVVFSLMFAPTGLMLFGMLSMDDEPGRWRTVVVGGGVLGACLSMIQNVWGAYLIIHDPARFAVSWKMHAIGIAAGLACASYYLVLVRRAPLGHEALVERSRSRALVRDWALLAISVCFVVAGMVIAKRSMSTAIVTIVFFGACGIVPAASLLRRRGVGARELALPPDRTLRPLRGRVILAFGGGLVVCLVVAHFGTSYPLWARGLSALVALACVGGLVAVALGRAPVGHLRFDHECLVVGHRNFEMHAPWSAIASVDVGEYMNNSVVLIQLNDLTGVFAMPPEQLVSAQKALAQSRAWTGAPIMIMTSSYGFDPQALALLLRRESESRAREAT